jgi:hypothetical protein
MRQISDAPDRILHREDVPNIYLKLNEIRTFKVTTESRFGYGCSNIDNFMQFYL